MNILGSIKFDKTIYGGDSYTALKHVIQHDNNDYEVIEYKCNSKSIDLDVFQFRGIEVNLDYEVQASLKKPFTTVLLAVELVKFIRESRNV